MFRRIRESHLGAGIMCILKRVADRAFQPAGQFSFHFKVQASKVQRSRIREKEFSICRVKLLADQATDGVVKSRDGHAEVIGKVLFPYQFHGLDGFRPERRIGFVSGRIVEKLKQVGSAKGLAVKKFEGRFFPWSYRSERRAGWSCRQMSNSGRNEGPDSKRGFCEDEFHPERKRRIYLRFCSY